MLAGKTIATFFKWLKCFFVSVMHNFKGALFCKYEPMPCTARRVGTIKGINAKLDALINGSKVGNAKQMIWFIFGQLWQGKGEHINHLFTCFAKTAANSKAIER